MNVDTMKLSRKIKEIFSCDDLLEKKFEAGGCRFCLMYIDAMTDKAELEESVVEKLIKADSFGKPYETCIPNIPLFKGCSVGNAESPNSVHPQGISAFSIKARSSACAFPNSTP